MFQRLISRKQSKPGGSESMYKGAEKSPFIMSMRQFHYKAGLTLQSTDLRVKLPCHPPILLPPTRAQLQVHNALREMGWFVMYMHTCTDLLSDGACHLLVENAAWDNVTVRELYAIHPSRDPVRATVVVALPVRQLPAAPQPPAG